MPQHLVLPRGLGPAVVSHPGYQSAVCACRRGRQHPRRLWGPGRKACGARGRAQARRSVSHCGECRGWGVGVTALRKSLPTQQSQVPPQGRAGPGESGHTHTTRRQIIQDTILQPRVPREPHRKTPSETLTRVWCAGDRRNCGSQAGSRTAPRGGGAAGGAGRPGPSEPLGAGGRAPAQRPRPGSYGDDPHFQPRKTGSAAAGGSRPAAGVGGLARASLRVPGPQAPATARGGVCNSLESCTEPGSAQPQASAPRASAERPEGAGRGQGARPAL